MTLCMQTPFEAFAAKPQPFAALLYSKPLRKGVQQRHAAKTKGGLLTCARVAMPQRVSQQRVAETPYYRKGVLRPSKACACAWRGFKSRPAAKRKASANANRARTETEKMTRPKPRKHRTSLKAENAKAAKFQGASKMPPLRHKTCEPFDVMRSEVCDWLWATQPEIRQLVFDMAKNTGLIEYDAEDGVWYGIDY